MSTLAPIAFFLVFAAVLALIVTLVVRSRRREGTMRDDAVGAELAKLASARGWQYVPEQAGYADRFTGYPFGPVRTKNPAWELVTGTYRGREFSCFQYTPRAAERPGEPDQYREYFRVFMVSLPSPCPTLEITKAGPGPLAMRKFTTGNREFDQKFEVSTDDERFAAQVLTEPQQQWLMSDTRAANYPLRFELDQLTTWYKQKGRFDPSSIEPVLDFLCDVLDRTPDAVR